MRYKVGDKVRIKSIDWYNENKDADGIVKLSTHVFIPEMIEHCGQIVTIKDVFEYTDSSAVYYMKEIDWDWTDEMIECKVEEETEPEVDYVAAMDDLVGLDIERSCILNEYDEYKKAVEEHGFYSEEALSCKYFIHLRKIGTAQNILEKFGFNLPDGYVFKDENDNEILTSKIILEKKKEKYPKTYEECCEILQYNKYLTVYPPFNADIPNYDALHLFDLLEALRKLRICRDAYWKIAGEEMGLGKSWEPDWNDGKLKWCMSYSGNCIEFDQYKSKHHIIAFPTEEMLNAFKENFDPDIEFCKEFL